MSTTSEPRPITRRIGAGEIDLEYGSASFFLHFTLRRRQRQWWVLGHRNSRIGERFEDGPFATRALATSYAAAIFERELVLHRAARDR
jgi:hypothetical protein